MTRVCGPPVCVEEFEVVLADRDGLADYVTTGHVKELDTAL